MRPFDAEGNYVVVAQAGGLRRNAIRSAGVTVFAQVFAFAVQMISTVVLARILTPEDFGIVTMVTTFSILLMSCGRVGFPEAILQREHFTHQLISNLFWINVGVGLFLTLGFAACGPLLAHFYHEPRLAHIAIGASVTVVIDSTSILHLALLKRAMRFATVSRNDIFARFISVAVSVVTGLLGWGYWSLIVGAIAYPLSITIGAWTLCRWIPTLPRRAEDTMPMLRFAAQVFGRFSIGYVNQNTDNLLVGWRFGSVSLGFYKKAYDLFVLPFSLLTVYPVAVSALSRLSKDRVQFIRYFLNGLSILALVGMGIGLDLTLVGKDLVRLILGSQWSEAGRIFTMFGPGVGGMLIYATNGMIHLSLGTPGRYFRWGVFELVFTMMLFGLTLHWGPTGIAAAWTACYWLLMAPSFWYAGKPIDLGLGQIFGVIWRFIAASIMAALCAAVIVSRFSSLAVEPGALGAFNRVMVKSSVFAVLYIASVILLHGGLAPFRQLIEYAREMLPSRKKLNPATAVTAESITEEPAVVADKASV